MEFCCEITLNLSSPYIVISLSLDDSLSRRGFISHMLSLSSDGHMMVIYYVYFLN